MPWPDTYSKAVPGATVQPGQLSAEGLDQIAGTPAWELPAPRFNFGLDDGAIDFEAELRGRHEKSKSSGLPAWYFVGELASKMVLDMDCLVDEGLIARTRNLPLGHDQRPNRTLFWREVLAETSSAVEPNFGPQAINAYNTSLYGNPSLIFNPENAANRVATFFTEGVSVNWLIGGLAASMIAPGTTLRLKELSSGPRTGRWEPMYEAAYKLGEVARIEATVSDFIEPAVPHVALTPDQVSFTTERHNLLDSTMPELSAQDRYNVMLATYSFDTVWMPGDIRLVRFGDQWLQTVYRLKVSDTYSRQQELLAALRNNEPLQDATAADYRSVFIETTYIPFNINNHPYATQLDRFIPNGLPVNVPGGYIETVVEAFKKQLTPDGAFIIGEAGIFEDTQQEVNAYDHSGAALYKHDHYGLAQTILREVHGLDVQTYRLPKLADTFLRPGWRTREETSGLQAARGNRLIVARRHNAPTYQPRSGVTLGA